jgi:ribosomal protein L20A (L18A)
MKTYKINGTYKHRGEREKFSKTIKSEDEKTAREFTLCLLGGKQKIPRRNIEIETIDEVK